MIVVAADNLLQYYRIVKVSRIIEFTFNSIVGVICINIDHTAKRIEEMPHGAGRTSHRDSL
jgi:hypothetical protein